VTCPQTCFPASPLVYLSVNPQRQLPNATDPYRRSAGLWIDLNARKTLDAARRLQPEARQIVVIDGSSPTERLLLSLVRSQIEKQPNPLPVIYLTNQSFAETSKAVATLRRDTIVLFISLARDGQGHPYVSADNVGKFATTSGAPIYVLFDSAIGSGSLGGYVTRFGEVGKQGAEMGLQFLRGQHPNDQIARSDYVFDWRQLQRWKISESVLPVGSIVINRQPTIWESYKWYVFGALLLFFAETLLILALLWQRSKKNKFRRFLVDKLAFEKMLSDLSTTFIQLPEELVGETIQKSLGRVAALLKLDRISIFDYVSASAELKATYSRHNEAIQAIQPVIEANKFPRCTNLLLQGEKILLPSPTPPPEEVIEEMKLVHDLGANSIAVVLRRSAKVTHLRFLKVIHPRNRIRNRI
jgi:hypothetical protein